MVGILMAKPRNNAETVAEIVSRRDTSNPKGTLSAEWLNTRSAENRRGELPDTIGSPINYGDDVYVVYSYDTPILWWVESDRRWYAPKVRYSPTTSQHQMSVSWALLSADQGVVDVFGTPTHGWKRDRYDKVTLHRAKGDKISDGKGWQG